MCCEFNIYLEIKLILSVCEDLSHLLISFPSVNPGYEEAVFPDYPQDAYSGAGPSIPLERRGSDASSYHSDDVGLRHRNWAKEDGPRDTAILLESLPSKQLGTPQIIYTGLTYGLMIIQNHT